MLSFVSKVMLTLLVMTQLLSASPFLQNVLAEGNGGSPPDVVLSQPNDDSSVAQDSSKTLDSGYADGLSEEIKSEGNQSPDTSLKIPEGEQKVSEDTSKSEETSEKEGKSEEKSEKEAEEIPVPEERVARTDGEVFSYRAAGDDRASTGPKERYGVVRANIDTFAYYEIKNVTSGVGEYHWYGAGLDVYWQLPAEAKEGDYFTLKLPPEIELDQAPIFGSNDVIDYRNLDKNISNDKLFFQITTTPRTDGGAGIPILNVYYTKQGELAFVAQKFVNDKEAIGGNAIIGRPVDTNRLVAFTDGNGRHYKKGYEAKYNSPGGHQKQDLEQLLQSGRTYYEGFRPNKFLLSAYRGAKPTNNISTFLGKTIEYKTSYNGLQEFNIEDSAYVNYQTELYKHWSYNSFGETTIYPVREDKDYIYYNLVYNGARTFGTAPLGLFGGRKITLDLSDKGQGSMRLEKPEDIRVYSGYTGPYAGAGVQSIVPSMEWYEAGATVKDRQFEKVRGLDKYRFTVYGGEGKNTYFAEIKLRKVKQVRDNEGRLGYKVSLQVDDSYHREYDDFYHSTSGLGSGTTVPRSPSAVLYPALNITKTDENGNVVTPRLKKQDEKTVFTDDFGNTYTQVDGTDDQYQDQLGRILKQRRNDTNELVYENESGVQFTRKKEGEETIYKDSYGFTYRKKAGTLSTYVSTEKSKDIKTPVEFRVDTTNGLKFIANGEELDVLAYSVWYDQLNQRHLLENLISPMTGNTYEVDLIDKGDGSINIYTLLYNSRLMALIGKNGNFSFTDTLTVAPVPSFELPRPVLATDGNAELQALAVEDVTIAPVVEDPFIFTITDTETGDVFSHDVNEFGQAVFPSLLKEHYYQLNEVRSATGYIKDPETYIIDIDKNGQVTMIKASDQSKITKDTYPMAISDEGTITFALKNDRETKLAIRKVDEADQLITSAPATFKLYAPGEYTKSPDGKIKIEDGATGVTLTTTQKGSHGLSEATKVSPISNGVYVLVEDKAPDGYEKLIDFIELQLQTQTSQEGVQSWNWQLVTQSDKVTLEDDGITIKVQNKKSENDFKLKVLKRDYHKENMGLDAEISLYKATLDKDGHIQKDQNGIKKELVIAKRTNENNNNSALFEGLKPGTYVLAETDVPKGYQKLTQEYVLVIEKDGKVRLENGDHFVQLKDPKDHVIELTLKNLKKGEYPSTGGKGIQYFIIIGSFAIAIGLYAHHRQSKSRYRRRRR